MRILVISAVGIYTSYRAIAQLDHQNLFDQQVNAFYALIAAITFLVIFLSDKRQFKRTRNWRSFIASFIGVIIFVGHFLVVYTLNQRDKSPSEIYCVTKINDFNGVSIDFRKDGTYKLTSWCLGADIYRGKFTIKDSVIIIDQTKIENVIVSNKFVIRQDGELDSTGKREKSVYQVDQQGQVINRSADFRVIDGWNDR